MPRHLRIIQAMSLDQNATVNVYLGTNPTPKAITAHAEPGNQRYIPFFPSKGLIAREHLSPD